MHLTVSASQFRKFGLGVDYLSAQATGADGEKRSVKTGSIIFFFFSLLIWGWGEWKYLNWWQMAPVASEKPRNCPAEVAEAAEQQQ